jgi:hypothetical protein
LLIAILGLSGGVIVYVRHRHRATNKPCGGEWSERSGFGRQFAMIFDEIYPGLWRFLECLLGRHNVAQDIAQESFLRPLSLLADTFLLIRCPISVGSVVNIDCPHIEVF